MTITEFLTARYDEDEAVARGLIDRSPEPFRYQGDRAKALDHWCVALSPESFLADIAAKRAIVALHGTSVGMDTVLDLLAQPYAEHPDFDQAWRMA